MKKIILIIAFIFTGFFTTNAQEETFQITVFISGLDSNEGQVLIALHNEKAQFLKTDFKNAITKITDKKVTYTFKKIIERFKVYSKRIKSLFVCCYFLLIEILHLHILEDP